MTKPIEKALGTINNRFLLTTVVSRRWENLVAGAPALIDQQRGQSKVEVALQEVIEGKVTVDTETRVISLADEPQIELQQEPVFSEAVAAEHEKPKRG